LPWIALDDVVGAILHLLDAGSLSRAVNVTVPDPLTNEEYTKSLGRVLRRPTVFPLPAPAARIALGQVADELLLASQRVEPARLRESGYSYRYPELEGALRHLLGK
jgi:NAD dependent epimerase/dehydratase family enzyme